MNKQRAWILVILFFLTGIIVYSCRHGAGKTTGNSDTLAAKIPKTANPPIDKSSMDISYFPADFPVKKMGGVEKGNPVARIMYSRPAIDKRVIFGNIVRYGKPWRMGANEATEIEFFRNVRIMGQSIPAGRYVLYCIPYEDKWNIKLNADLYTWGLKINNKKDLFSFEVPVQPLGFTMEYLSMQFVPTNEGALLRISWDKIKTELPINL